MTSYRTSLFTSYICSLVMNKNYGMAFPKIHEIPHIFIHSNVHMHFSEIFFQEFKTISINATIIYRSAS